MRMPFGINELASSFNQLIAFDSAAPLCCPPLSGWTAVLNGRPVSTGGEFMSYFRTRLLVGAAIAAIAMPSFAVAQDLTLEGETVTIIVPFAEGGGADRLTRILVPSL